MEKPEPNKPNALCILFPSTHGMLGAMAVIAGEKSRERRRSSKEPVIIMEARKKGGEGEGGGREGEEGEFGPGRQIH
jgi:hypothetical protein